jgi:hypothetical protein
MTTLVLLAAGSLIAVVIYLASGGHIIFLPLILVLPLGFAFRRRSPPT